MKICIDCGASKSKKGVYCKTCSYKHRVRPSGLKYNIKALNKGWFKKGERPNSYESMRAWWADEDNKKTMRESRKGVRVSPSTEFKYKNGNGYRHLLLKGVLPQYCEVCLDEPVISRLQVHHKDGNRKNNERDNLQVLCRPCHLSHHNRQERVYVEGRVAV